MRLLHTTTYKLYEFFGADIPPYAILSHTWDREEVSYDDLTQGLGPSRLGWQKLTGFCKQALAHGYHYVWIDTCCIDKSSSAELSESINSMFRWYEGADVCYAYLQDVPTYYEWAFNSPYGEYSHFRQARWFSRGWTLQELLAPPIVLFYSRDWIPIGSRNQLGDLVSEITGIDQKYFETGDLSRYSIAQKMFWASRRKTTRTEDEAYCLLGIFNINMPLIYGEGRNAFRRLQEEIVRQLDTDYSIFALGKMDRFLAQQPLDFWHAGDIDLLSDDGLMHLFRTGKGASISSRGIQITLPVLSENWDRDSGTWYHSDLKWALLGCKTSSGIVAIGLVEESPGIYTKPWGRFACFPGSCKDRVQLETVFLRLPQNPRDNCWKFGSSQDPAVTIQVLNNPDPDFKLKLNLVDKSIFDFRYEMPDKYHLRMDGFSDSFEDDLGPPEVSLLFTVSSKKSLHFEETVVAENPAFSKDLIFLLKLTPTRASVDLRLYSDFNLVERSSDDHSEELLDPAEGDINGFHLQLSSPSKSGQARRRRIRKLGQQFWLSPRIPGQFHPSRGVEMPISGNFGERVVKILTSCRVAVEAKRQPGKWWITISALDLNEDQSTRPSDQGQAIRYRDILTQHSSERHRGIPIATEDPIF